MSTGSLRGGDFLISWRMRPSTSPARLASLTMRVSASPTSLTLGGCAPSQRSPAWALVTVAAIGWLTSCAIDAASCPMVATRLACASSVCTSR
ncbi:hypothetical protein D3C86_1421620 [compost metagenome]